MFKWLSRLLIARNFNSVCINGEFTDNKNSVLVIANHVSWWDGFWVEYLNQKLLQRKFHFMMLENQLKKHWYFRYTGGYSVKKKSRSIIDSINYSIKLLQQCGNMVLIFPQGEIHSIHNDVLVFDKGVERIINKIAPKTQVVFVVNLIDYLSNRKPKLYIYVKPFLAQELQYINTENEYNVFYKKALNFQKAKMS